MRTDEEVLIIDPYLTRIPFRQMWVGRVHSNRELVAAKIRRCDCILVTHAHFDHLLDVPEIARQTGALVLGSYNTCSLLATLGVPGRQLREIQVGDRLGLGSFQVTALESLHIPTPGFSSGPLSRSLRPPLRARDYRMDGNFAFFLQVGGYRLLTDTGRRAKAAVPADVLFANLLKRPSHYTELLRRVQPRLIVPIHWDDMWRSSFRSVRPLLTFPQLNPRLLLPRANMEQWKKMIGRRAPETRVLVPEIFHTYALEQLLSPVEDAWPSGHL